MVPSWGSSETPGGRNALRHRPTLSRVRLDSFAVPCNTTPARVNRHREQRAGGSRASVATVNCRPPWQPVRSKPVAKHRAIAIRLEVMGIDDRPNGGETLHQAWVTRLPEDVNERPATFPTAAI